jgi:hypothetical protein
MGFMNCCAFAFRHFVKDKLFVFTSSHIKANLEFQVIVSQGGSVLFYLIGQIKVCNRAGFSFFYIAFIFQFKK